MKAISVAMRNLGQIFTLAARLVVALVKEDAVPLHESEHVRISATLLASGLRLPGA